MAARPAGEEGENPRDGAQCGFEDPEVDVEREWIPPPLGGRGATLKAADERMREAKAAVKRRREILGAIVVLRGSRGRIRALRKTR